MIDRTMLFYFSVPLALLAFTFTAAGAKETHPPPHPRLLFNRQGITDLKDRIARCDWAREQWESLKGRADEALGEDVELPPRGGNWTHWYACPEHGAPLRKGEQIGDWQWKHTCPVGGEELRSDAAKSSTDYDGCVISGIHGAYSRTVRELGVVYQVTGDRRYAQKARDILLAYAGRYASYPLHNVHGEAKVGGGKVGAQSLDESVWLIPICQGADLIWETLKDSERNAIARDLLLPAVNEVILPHKLGIHNIQCWKNSAVGLVGFLLGNDELIGEAIRDPERGFRAQIEKGVMPDGGWWEGSWGYHFYTLSALWPLTEAARNSGIDLYDSRLKSMYDAPFRFAMPNLHLPAFNDSGEVNVLGQSAVYELAYARYTDPRYLTLLSSYGRRSDFALWFGATDLPAAPDAKWQSVNMPRSGYAILARGEGEDATWLCLKYGPHGGGHGHPDKLSFVLCARGDAIGVDPGSARYGLPIHAGWYRTTIAHNTLTVDAAPQKTAEGRCIGFGSENGVDYIVADAGHIYDGSRFVRGAALVGEDLLVFVDLVTCDSERVLDIAYHQRGKWVNLPKGKPWNAPEKPGYSYLQDATTRTTSGLVALDCAVREDFNTAIAVACGDPVEVITATGVGANVGDRVPVVILRKRAREAAFIWSISLSGKAPRIERLNVRGADENALPASAVAAVRVADADGTARVMVINPDKRTLSITLPDGTRWNTDSAFAVR